MPVENSLIDEAKLSLDKIAAEGYVLRQIKFEPRKGCRVCLADGVHLTIIFLGKKVDETRTFLYCMAKVCIPCLAIGEAEESLSVQMDQTAGGESDAIS